MMKWLVNLFHQHDWKLIDRVETDATMPYKIVRGWSVLEKCEECAEFHAYFTDGESKITIDVNVLPDEMLKKAGILT